MFKWLPIFQLTVEPSILTAWMSFEGLSIHFFNKSALFSIATTMVKPLKIDGATANFTRPSIARVCIKVDMLKPLPQWIWIGIAPFYIFWQAVLYEDVPTYCTHCSKFGHSASQCCKNTMGNNVLQGKKEVEDPILKGSYSSMENVSAASLKV